MKVLLQRVSRASVRVGGDTIASIDRGLLALVAVERGDSNDDAAYLAAKTVDLRLFPDENDRMNRSLVEVSGELLVVSQFTLAATTRRGRRPSFARAAEPELARSLYEQFASLAGDRGVRVALGSFQSMMEVELVNDGPVTIMLDPRQGGER